MANRFTRVAIPGGDDGVWDQYEEPINLLGLGNNTLKLYDDSGTLKLAQGRCGLDDGSQKGACIVDTLTTISIAALTVSLWAKVELSKTGTTLNIEITSIVGENDPETLPVSFTGGYDADKQGFYITGTKRCIGLAWINAGGTLEGVVNCLSGESYSGYSTSDDANDYIYKFLKLNGYEPDYYNKDAPQTINEGEITGAVEFLTGAKNPIAVYEHQATSGTDGGATTGDSTWRDFTLNTEIYDDIGCSVASNAITIPPGTYIITGWHEYVNGGNRDAVRLRDTTGAATLARKNVGAEPGNIISVVTNLKTSPVVFSVSSAIKIQYFGTNSYANGQGLAVTSGEVEVYGQVYIMKIG